MTIISAEEGTQTMQEQNRAFEILEPNRFRRTMLMAADMKRAINERYKREQANRTITKEEIKNVIWRNNS